MSENHHKFEKSTSISHCDYNDTEGTLEICFTSGNTYHYECPKIVYEALKTAESAGAHFHKHIRPKYKHIIK